MKKFKKIIIIFTILIILIFVHCIYLKYRGREILNRESIAILEEVISPNKKYKAIIFFDTGNATVSKNIRVAVTKNNRKKFYDSDIIFLENRIDNILVTWENNNTLLVKYTKDIFSEIIKKIDKVNNIDVVYKKVGN